MITDGMPCRIKLYWSLRTNRFRSGSGSATAFTPSDFAMAAARSPRVESLIPCTRRIFKGTMGKNMSILMSATMDFASTVGCAVKYFEPSSPFSSAVTSTNKIDRFSFSGCCFSEAAMSNAAAAPLPSSIAPL